LNKDGGKTFFSWAHTEFTRRWEIINALFDPATQTRFTQMAAPHGFYAYVRCNESVDAVDCAAAFLKAGIACEAGGPYGGTAAEVRLELVESGVTFDLLVQRIKTLV